MTACCTEYCVAAAVTSGSGRERIGAWKGQRFGRSGALNAGGIQEGNTGR